MRAGAVQGPGCRGGAWLLLWPTSVALAEQFSPGGTRSLLAP